jgi:hypothetical protein
MNDFEFLNAAHVALSKLYREASNAEESSHYRRLLEEAWRRVQLAARASAPRIVFASPCPGEWLIGIEGREQRYRSHLQGLSPAWLALSYAGSAVVRTADFCRPGASQPDTVVRTAIRAAGADWIERTVGCRPLADSMRGIQVEGGMVRYVKRPHDPDIFTGL